jgi:nitroreductase
MNVSQAVETRVSIRAFKPDPVPAGLVRAILDKARRSPSGGNLQPWRVYALAGDELARFLALVAARQAASPAGEPPEYDVYPADLWDPYRTRRFECGEDLYATIGIERENKLGRLMQMAKNYQFFGAPVGLFFCIDRKMGAPQWSDLGMFMQTVMLLATEAGLDTCAQEAWVRWGQTIGEFLNLPDEMMLFSGMALGYRDESAPINTLRTRRDPLEAVAEFRGFEL